MGAKKILLILILLFGEAVIIVGFLHFGRNLDSNILALNIVVSSLIYSLYFIDLFIPIIDLKSSHKKTVGSIGIRWFTVILYTIAAISAIVILNISYSFLFLSQLIIQCALLFALAGGLFFSLIAADKVEKVYEEEKALRSNLNEMKNRTGKILSKLELMKDIPTDVFKRITELNEGLRFINPNNTTRAKELENKYLITINEINDCLLDTPFNYEKIVEVIQQCEQIYKERKHDKR
ncbi:MAG: hypothetical protein M0P71_13475 [Melioribacteraceae bacterium]|nr:hypothetical protein [Melioribacteraceae bacterium]